MNLVTNASEAISPEAKHATVSVSTGVMECDHDYLEKLYLADLPAGNYVFVEVSDNGCGIDKETQERMFEPFFTTKFTGRGLGLSAVLGIVRGHKGTIKVYSEVGRGTTVKVLFPAGQGTAAQAAAPSAQRVAPQGHGTILLVDDEETVLTTATRILGKAGFAVLTARDGSQALDAFRQHASEVVCVLLDLTMPQMSGEVTFRELRRLQPGVRVILSSGYNEQDVVQRFAGKQLTAFIQKPYSAAGLLACVGRVMQESAPPTS